MNVINKIPGPILVFMGASCLSFGGLIVKSFEGSTLWQILFWRSLFFSLTVLLFLIITYKKKLFKAFYDSGLPGLLVELFYHLVFVGTSLRCIIQLLPILILLFRRKYSF